MIVCWFCGEDIEDGLKKCPICKGVLEDEHEEKNRQISEEQTCEVQQREEQGKKKDEKQEDQENQIGTNSITIKNSSSNAAEITLSIFAAIALWFGIIIGFIAFIGVIIFANNADEPALYLLLFAVLLLLFPFLIIWAFLKVFVNISYSLKEINKSIKSEIIINEELFRKSISHQSVDQELIGKWRDKDDNMSGVEFTESTYQWFSEGKMDSKFSGVYTDGDIIFIPDTRTETINIQWKILGNNLTLIWDDGDSYVYQKVSKFSWE